jgi:hypothetical protein
MVDFGWSSCLGQGCLRKPTGLLAGFGKYSFFGSPQNSPSSLQLSMEWEKKKKGLPFV